MGIWDDLKRRLVVQYASEGEVKTPSPEDLDRFERESGFRLPEDYREFATTFGPGTYGPGWQVETPGFAKPPRGKYKKAPGRYDGLDGLYRQMQGYNPGFVVFCGKQDFHGWVAWDPKDVTDPVARDYGVYVLGGPSGEEPDSPPPQGRLVLPRVPPVVCPRRRLQAAVGRARLWRPGRGGPEQARAVRPGALAAGSAGRRLL